jgi:type 1 glutamine amidotransferase
MDKKKILVLCGDAWHPAETAQNGLRALAGVDFAFDWIEDAQHWTPDIMASYPLVLLTRSDNISVTDKTGWMTNTVQSAFWEYVQQGHGLLAIHSGTAGYEHKPVIRSLLGGVFLHHPDQCLVTMDPRPDHPLCKGVIPFTLQDEHYFMALDDAQADVFMTTRSVNGDQPGAWRREVGKGRVAVLTPGHQLDVWVHPSYQAMLVNVLHWCGRLL